MDQIFLFSNPPVSVFRVLEIKFCVVFFLWRYEKSRSYARWTMALPLSHTSDLSSYFLEADGPLGVEEGKLGQHRQPFK